MTFAETAPGAEDAFEVTDFGAGAAAGKGNETNAAAEPGKGRRGEGRRQEAEASPERSVDPFLPLDSSYGSVSASEPVGSFFIPVMRTQVLRTEAKSRFLLRINIVLFSANFCRTVIFEEFLS